MELQYLEKYIICQPLGGINDMLCQIGHCIEYAEKFKRILLIDTMPADLHDHFSNYFQLIKPTEYIQLKLDDDQIQRIHDDPMYTLGLDLRYNVRSDATNLNIRPLDMESDSVDKYVVHRDYGGGLQSLYALKYITLLPHLADEIKSRKRSLGEYQAVLIRNTDYQTDYKTALAKIKALNNPMPLYLFTDDYMVQDFAKTLGFTKLIINENLYKSNTQYLPIMHVSRVSSVPPAEINIQVLSDLFLSALSTYIYPTYVMGYLGDKRFELQPLQSGFIRLSIALNQDRMLLNSILSIE